MSYSTLQDGAGTCTSQCTSNTIDGEDGCVMKKEETENQIEDPGILDGAGGNMADSSDLSSDEDSEKCPICLNSFHQQPVATPESCDHYFCVDCILEWAKNANSCPVDRQTFCSILLRKCHGGTVLKRVVVEKASQTGPVEALLPDLDQTSCEVCGGRDREDCLLLCDNCDAGYHMDCLVPALATVPVEEWFCPQCSAHHPSGASQLSEDHLPTASHFRSTRAIARTQHSERVRANVNQRRITQAGTAAQLARGYMTQSTWLDDAINAVVAGLNTAVYVRDLTPRAKSRRRRKRRTDAVNTRKTKSSSSLSLKKKRKTKSKRRKRKVSQFKLRRQLTKTDSRSRIKQSLGSKAKQSSVYQHAKDSLGIMRSEIGAPSLSVYGDPFVLDPFDNRDEESPTTPTTSSAVNAKRRTLSRSALRSHQPVSRAFLSLSRPPVPDLLGSILSGQSALLMDSSDVVIHPDGSLQPVKTVSSAAALPDSCPSAPSRSEPEPASVRKSPAATHTHSPFRSISSHAEREGRDSLHRSHLRHPAAERKAHKPAAVRRKPCKPSWLDVSVLPRIPKIKREENSAANPNPERPSTSSSSSHKPHLKPDRSTHTARNVQRSGSTGFRRSDSDTGDITLINTALKLPAEDVNTHSLMFPKDIKTDKGIRQSCESGSKPRQAICPIKVESVLISRDQQTANNTERDCPGDGWESSETSVAASTSGPRERRVASGSLESEKHTGPQKREGYPTSTKVLPSSCQNTTELVDSRPKSCRETELQDSHQKERFLKKLHVQQRVIEMVKLAMKPFYQRGDVTKDEYKDISRKAVQKVCHSGSVEVDPVKVTNLVRAYVQKVKSTQRQGP